MYALSLGNKFIFLFCSLYFIVDTQIFFSAFLHSSVKNLFTNKTYVMLFISFGSMIGFFNCYATQMEQFMCSRGYSNKFSGLAVTLLISVGLVGSVIAGVITEITGRLEEVAKFCNCCGCFVLVLGLVQVLRKPDLEVAALLFCSV